MKGMPTNKQYVVHHGDKFGTVSLGIVYGQDMVFADVWARKYDYGNVPGAHRVHQRNFAPRDWQKAVGFVEDHVGDRDGKWRVYKTPYQLAQEFWPQDFKEETS